MTSVKVTNNKNGPLRPAQNVWLPAHSTVDVSFQDYDKFSNKSDWLVWLGFGWVHAVDPRPPPPPAPVPIYVLGGLSVATADILRETAVTEHGTVATLRGYYQDNDGGGGTFLWHAGSTTPDDGGMVFGSTSLGRWKRLTDKHHISVKWYGAKGDRIQNDTPFVQASINGMYAHGIKKCFVPMGFYNITYTLRMGAPYGNATNGLSLEGVGQADNGFGSVFVWEGAEIESILNIQGMDPQVRDLGFIAGTGKTCFAGINIGNGTAADAAASGYGTYTTRATVEGCFFGDTRDEPTTVCQRGISIDARFPTDGNKEELLFSRNIFINCLIGVHIGGGQPYNVIIEKSTFRCRYDRDGAKFGIAIYSNITGGYLPYDLSVRDNEFLSMCYVYKCTAARRVQFSGNSTEHCKIFYQSGFSFSSVGDTVDILSHRMNMGSVHKAFQWDEPNGNLYGGDPTAFTLYGFPATDANTRPPAFMHFGQGETVNLIGNAFRGGSFEGDGDRSRTLTISKTFAGTVVSTGNKYAGRRPFVIDDQYSEGQSPYQFSNVLSIGGWFSTGDSGSPNTLADASTGHPGPKQTLAPMFGCNNPPGTITFSGTQTTRNFDSRAPQAQQNINPIERGAEWAYPQASLPYREDVGWYQPHAYNVDVSVQSTTGTPPAGGFYAWVSNKTGYGFTVNLNQAPGPGNTVTVAYKPWK